MKWRKIPGFSRYQVSDTGLIRLSLDAPRKRKQRLKPGALVTLRLMAFGYSRCELMSDAGKNMTITSHHAIALAFCGPKPSKNYCALHWDDNPANNVPKNIRWGTKGDNIKDMVRNGGLLQGQDCTQAKLTNAQVKEIRRRFRIEDRTLKSFGEEFKVSLDTIHLIVKGKTWRHVQ